MVYRDINVFSAGALFSGAFGYRDLEMLLEELLVPGAFPVRAELVVGDLVLLHGADGMAVAYVQSLNIDRRPILAPLLGSIPAPALARPVVSARKAA